MIPLPSLSMGLQLPKTARRAPSLSPEEEQGLISKALSGIMGGVEWGALALDKPGAAVRGVLSGISGDEWGGGLLNLVPFSDTFGLTDPASRVYGRDLLATWGAPENEEGLFVSPQEFGLELGGFGVDVLTDPLIFLKGPASALSPKGVAHLAAKAKTILPKGKVTQDLAGTVARFVKEAKALGKPAAMGSRLHTSPASAAEEIAQGLRGIVGVGRPFSGKSWVTFGAGSKWAPKVIMGLGYNPVTRVMRGLISPGPKGRFAKDIQIAADAAWAQKKNMEALRDDLAPVFVKRWGDLRGTWDAAIKHATAQGIDTKAFDFDEVMGALAEAGDYSKSVFKDLVAKKGLKTPEEFEGLLYSTIDDLHVLTDFFLEKLNNLGLPVKGFEDLYGTAYVPRIAQRQAYAAGATRAEAQKLLDKHFGHALARRSWARNFPGGVTGQAGTLNNLSKDVVARGYKHMGGEWFKMPDTVHATVLISALNKLGVETPGVPALRELAAKYARASSNPALQGKIGKKIERLVYSEDWGNVHDLVEEYILHNYIAPNAKWHGLNSKSPLGQLLFEGSPLGKELSETLADGTKKILSAVDEEVLPKARELAEWVAGLPKGAMDTGIYTPSVLDATFAYTEHALTAMSNLTTGRKFLHDAVKHVPEGGFVPEGMIPLKQALADVVPYMKDGKKKFRHEGFLSKEGRESFVYRQSLDEPSNVVRSSVKKDLDKFANELFVPENTVGVLNAYVESLSPKVEGALLQLFDKATTLWKGSVTIPHPGFNSRNWATAIWQSWADGDIGFWQLIKAHGRMIGDLHLGKLKSLKYFDEAFGAHDPLKINARQILDTLGPEAAGDALQMLPTKAHLPGAWLFEPVWEGWGKKGWGHKLNPLAWPGVVAEETPKFIPADVGRRAYTAIEALFARYVPYELLRDKGFTPAQAAYRVVQTQFEYGPKAMSPFVRDYGRRMVPFAQWTTKNIPLQLARLISEPGGRTAQAARAMGTMVRGSGEMPSHLREAGAARLGGPDQQATFLTYSPIPLHDLQRFRFDKGRPDVGATFTRSIADLHPAASTAYKLLTGEDPFFGRDVPKTGRWGMPGWADTTLRGLPGSRTLSTYDQLRNDRKHIIARLSHVLLGMRFSTQDVDAAILREYKEHIEAKLRNFPEIREHVTAFIPSRKRADASEAARAELDEYRRAGQLLADYYKKLDKDDRI